MEYCIIRPTEIVKDEKIFSGQFNVTDFDQSNKYKSYKANFLKYLNIILKKYSVTHDVRSKLLDRYTQPSKFIQLRSDGLMINFNWPSGELKTMILMDKYLITDQLYWLQYYPFIDLVEKEEGSYIRINKAFEEKAFVYESNDQKMTLITHNNHFGHFFFDDFPRILLDSLQYPAYIAESVRPECLSKGIEDLISTSIPDLSKTNVARKDEMSIIKSNNILQSFITNPILNSYLIKKNFQLHRNKVQETCRQASKIYIKRSGKYQSRIKNHDEVLALLESQDFTSCDPSNYSTLELIEKLSNASIIVTEAGTSCLVASLYSPTTAKIIALVPKDLLKCPEEDMIISGLPYHLASPGNIEFVLGEKADQHKIQSSKQCLYSIRNLKKLIVMHEVLKEK